MDLTPEDALKKQATFNFAPMMDFLFLMMSLFAVLAISRSSIFDTEVKLYKTKHTEQEPIATQPHANISIVIDQYGKYAWISELSKYPLENKEKVQEEIIRRYDLGLIPKEKNATKVLLHIDENAPWGKVANLIFAIREIGFYPHPIYENDTP